VVRKAPIEHIQLTLDLHREAVDCVLDFGWRIGVEMSETTAKIRSGAHLPEQPGEALGTRCALARQQLTELLGQVEQDRAGFEHPYGFRRAAVQERRNLRVRVDGHETAAELLPLTDIDEPRIVLGAAATERQQLL